MSRVVKRHSEEKPKSIEQLEKELYTEYKGYKESSNNIKEQIKEIKNYNNAAKDYYKYFNQYGEFKVFESNFETIKKKINFIDELINDLKKQSKDETSIDNINVISEDIVDDRMRELGIFEKKKIRTTYDLVIKKHINYLNYLKKILQTKIIKDVKIMSLFEAIMINTTNIFLSIDNIKKFKDEKIRRKRTAIKDHKKRKMKDEILKCNKDLKKELNTISGLSNVKYDKDILKKIDKSILSSKIDECNKQISENLQNLINAVNTLNTVKIQVSKFRGGVKFPLNITNEKFIKKLSEITKNEENAKKTYTKDLKKIKDAYEKGLKENIEDFKAICKALTEYLKKLQEIIKEFLSGFLERSVYFKKRKEKIYKIAKEEINGLLENYLLNISKKQGKEQIDEKIEELMNIRTLIAANIRNVELSTKSIKSIQKKNIELENIKESFKEKKDESLNKLNEIRTDIMRIEMSHPNYEDNEDEIKEKERELKQKLKANTDNKFEKLTENQKNNYYNTINNLKVELYNNTDGKYKEKKEKEQYEQKTFNIAKEGFETVSKRIEKNEKTLDLRKEQQLRYNNNQKDLKRKAVESLSVLYNSEMNLNSQFKKMKMEGIKKEIDSKIKEKEEEKIGSQIGKINKKIHSDITSKIENLDNYLNRTEEINNLNSYNLNTQIINRLSKIINKTKLSLLKLYQEYQIIDGNEIVPYYKFDEKKNEMLE